MGAFLNKTMDEESEPLDPEKATPDDLDYLLTFGSPATRRQFLKRAAGAGAAITIGPGLLRFATAQTPGASAAPAAVNDIAGGLAMNLKINGQAHQLTLDPRTTLLDTLREHLHFTGSKKGCDHGQCGACTVLVNGRRVNSCLLLAAAVEGDEITTIEGLAQGDELHPMQAAFLEHDGFQCGYCTPGQICSAVACVQEGHTKDDAQIREWMSGNLCRCGAYPNIVDAIREVAAKGA